MQSLLDASNPTGATEAACADDLIETIPLVMRVIRGHLRRHRSGLTVPQFRTLWFVNTAANQSISAAADYIGLSLPAMSRLVDGLVEQKLIGRKTCDADRRHVRLSITAAGERTLREACAMAQVRMADVLAQLPEKQKAVVTQAMQILRAAFTPELVTPES